MAMAKLLPAKDTANLGSRHLLKNYGRKKKMAKLLLGCTPRTGQTGLSLAAKNKRNEVAKLLLSTNEPTQIVSKGTLE